jgi:hypothetical protein
MCCLTEKRAQELTVDTSESDGEELILNLSIRKVGRVPDAGLVAARMFLHLCGRDHCTHKHTTIIKAATIRSYPKQTYIRTTAGGNSYRPRWLAHDEADLAVLLPLVPGTAWPSCNTATQPFPVDSAPDRDGTKGSVRGKGRRGEREQSLHVDEGHLLLLAGGDGDLLEPHDGRDLGSHAGEDGEDSRRGWTERRWRSSGVGIRGD